MRIFWEKNCKNRLSVGGSASEPLFAFRGWGFRPQTPALLLPRTITTLSSSFLVLNTFYSAPKRTKQLQRMFCLCFFRTFAPIF